MARARVLIVDDQPELRLLVALTLGGADLELTEAANGAEALAACAAAPPDIVLLDVVMPDMDGFEVCRRIKADPGLSATRVVLMTAADQAAQRRKGMDAGADHYVSKPFSPERLLQLITDLVAARGPR
jgi:CheY-like chemotaxis protein